MQDVSIYYPEHRAYVIGFGDSELPTINLRLSSGDASFHEAPEQLLQALHKRFPPANDYGRLRGRGGSVGEFVFKADPRDAAQFLKDLTINGRPAVASDLVEKLGNPEITAGSRGSYVILYGDGYIAKGPASPTPETSLETPNASEAQGKGVSSGAPKEDSPTSARSR